MVPCTMKRLKVAEYLHFLLVSKGIYIGWNRFYPSVFIFNQEAMDLLERIKYKKPIKVDNDIGYFLKEFKKYRFLYEGDVDPSRKNFVHMVQWAVAETDRRAGEFYRQKEDYDDLKIVNEECNLACSYCVNRHNLPAAYNHDNISSKESPGKRVSKMTEDKWTVVNQCVEQFISRKIANGSRRMQIFFNGGEILIEWPLIKAVVQRIAKEYKDKDIEIEYKINTNLTLLNEEIARFFSEYDFDVHISIDGYRSAHNRTRKYRSGRESFDDIIDRVKLYRKFNKEDSLTSFQGTIEHPEDFRAEEVYKMTGFGFVQARLAPNLLNVTEKDAVKKARLMGEFLELNVRHPLQVTELVFTRLKDKINQEEYRFSFNCQGLCCLPKMGLEINLSTLCLSHLCGFIPAAAVPIQELDHDIYNPKLWQVSHGFIKERMESVLKNCLECELVGICVGGCVMSGLDNYNRPNPAACAYQREMWKIYVRKAYHDSKAKNRTFKN